MLSLLGLMWSAEWCARLSDVLSKVTEEVGWFKIALNWSSFFRDSIIFNNNEQPLQE